MLSGGSSKGAWGAGLMNGWSKATTSPERPDAFDVVTGVSTGAVMATHVFLGETKDEQLRDGYTTTKNTDVYGFPYILTPHNLNGLRNLLKTKYLCDGVIDEVASASSHRKLYVGTVDLESSEFCAWDPTEIAVQKKYDLYREVILASSANPLGVWPIELDGKPHVDGGIRLRVFAESIVRAAGIAADHAEFTGEKFAYYVLNGKLRKGPKSVPSRDWPKILDRSLTLTLKEGTFGSLYAAWYHLNRKHAGWTFRGSWIPQDVDVPKNGRYVPEEMLALYDAGYGAGMKNDWFETDMGLPPPDYCRKEP